MVFFCAVNNGHFLGKQNQLFARVLLRNEVRFNSLIKQKLLFLDLKANCLKSLGLHEMQDLYDTKKCF